MSATCNLITASYIVMVLKLQAHNKR